MNEIASSLTMLAPRNDSREELFSFVIASPAKRGEAISYYGLNEK